MAASVRGFHFPLPEPPKSDKDLLAWARRLHVALPLILRSLPQQVVTPPSPSGFPAYTFTNRTPDHAYDADVTTINELANVMATFIVEETTTTPGVYTISNVTTDRAFDANATTLDELADVLGTVVADLTVGPPGAYTISNVSTRRAYDCTATTLDQLADTLGTFIHDCQVLSLLG